MSIAAKVLDRLDRVKQTRPNHWMARCPAHEDRSPSLSIRELDDGRILLHCFAECPIGDVLASLGLDFSDLFVKSSAHHLPPIRATLNARELIEVTAHEVFLASLLLHRSLERP
jgi:hypothetical protein